MKKLLLVPLALAVLLSGCAGRGTKTRRRAPPPIRWRP